MSLFGTKPAWRNKNPSVRRPAVAELRDAATLSKIAFTEQQSNEGEV